MTKGELRRARKAAREARQPLNGELAVSGCDETRTKPTKPKPQRQRAVKNWSDWYYRYGGTDRDRG